MVRRLVIEGDDGIRRWGFWVDDGDENQDSVDPPYMPAGTMRCSTMGQWHDNSGRVFPPPALHLDPGTATFRNTASLLASARLAIKEDAATPKPKEPTTKYQPATSFKNRPFTPVLQTSFASPRLPTMNDRPQTSLASGGASVFPKLSYDKRMPHYSRAQIEMCGRRRYTSRLTNSGGLGLTRITGY